MTSFVHRAITLWTLTANGKTERHAASAVYVPEDPFAVEFVIPRRGGGIPHSVVFARALLVDGVDEPVGEGVVRVMPHLDLAGWLLLVLPIDGERVEFWAEQAPVEEFVDATLLLLPSSRELTQLDLDGLIARLLGVAS